MIFWLSKQIWPTVLGVVAVCTCLNGQSLDSKLANMIVNEEEFTRAFQLGSKSKTLFKWRGRDYHWYKSNKVLRTRGGQGGRLLHGNYKEYYLNKNLRTDGTMRNGLKVGKWMYWHDNGMIARIDRYRCGRLRGRAIEYSRDGHLIATIKYRRGMKSGKERHFDDGQLVEWVKYKRNTEVGRAELNTSESDETKGQEDESSQVPSHREERKRIKKLVKKLMHSDESKTKGE